MSPWIDVEKPTAYTPTELVIWPERSGVKGMVSGLALDFLRPLEVDHGLVVFVEEHPSAEALRKLHKLLREEFVGARMGVLGLDSEPRDLDVIADCSYRDTHVEGGPADAESGEVSVALGHEDVVERGFDGAGGDIVDTESVTGDSDMDDRHRSSSRSDRRPPVDAPTPGVLSPSVEEPAAAGRSSGSPAAGEGGESS